MTDQEVVSLKEYLERRLTDLEHLMTARNVARNEAIEAARVEINRRLDEMNQLRHQIESERDKYMTRQAYEQYHEALITRVGALENWRANIVGRTVGLAVVGTIFVSVVVAVLTHLLSS